MNKSNLKTYAPQARRDFIDMVTSRAAQLGIAEQNGELKVENSLVQGEVLVIAGQAFPVKIELLRKRLLERIRQQGFSQTMEAIAYTWFNRFAALRYIELHDYLEHGQRVLSSVSAGGLPDILTHALDLAEAGELPTISRDMVADLKLSNKDGELYKRLLVAQCNKLATAMPFLFEKIDDDSELLLPDTLLRTDSVIRKLVDGIPEEDWQQVEVIGWLYQFYISEKKDQVIGKVVKSEDIPAATQLFTPNWIVKYLVQNSIGRLWLMANPHSGLAAQMEYYIQPAEQTPEVQAQLHALIKVRVEEDGETISPLSITVLDPACGSGHILVEAYDLLKAIYLERGYKLRDIPRLILKHNLFGLDIDDRAAQLAGFALLMKARADDRRLFENTPELNVFAIQDSKGVDDAVMAEVVMQAAIRLEGGEVLGNRDLFGGGALAAVHSSGLKAADLRELIRFFEFGKTYGSLLMVPEKLAGKLPTLEALLEQVIKSGDSLAKSYALQIQGDYLKPAGVLGKVYDAVVANPPYMGGKGMNEGLKDFAKRHFADSKSDLFAMFMERGFSLARPKTGFNALVTMQSWMFLSSFEAMRTKLLTTKTISSMAHLGARAFREISGEVVQTTAFVCLNESLAQFKPVFFRLVDGNDEVKQAALLNGKNRFDRVFQEDFKKIPSSPIAYWVSDTERDLYINSSILSSKFYPKKGMDTGENDVFLRLWWEIDSNKIALENVDGKWHPYNKGGSFRRWFGNRDYVVNWENNGLDIKSRLKLVKKKPTIRNEKFYKKDGFSWATVSSSGFSARYTPIGALFDNGGCTVFADTKDSLLEAGALLNSCVASRYLEFLSPTLNFQPGDISRILYIPNKETDSVTKIVLEAIEHTKKDWDSYETSWDFQQFPLLTQTHHQPTLANSYSAWQTHNQNTINTMQQLEQENNHIFIEAYSLQNELTPDVPLDQITLTVNPAYRYGGNLTPTEQQNRFQTDTCKELISYAIGNMMGRYSLNETGLIYAHANNIGFDPTRYTTFPADADGILPVTDILWFADDAANRVREFLLAVWGQTTLDENLLWLADSLGRKSEETPEEAIRRYIATSFYKDHLQTYKKRPIYWLFSSGKHKAFEALVYLHRYNEGTLSRMRTEYVVPLTGKMNDRIRFLETEVPKATSTAERKKLEKDIDRLKKKLDELRLYDEKLRHYADRRIALDLDDGVKVNYGKFGDLLAEVKAITGGSDE
ncbi:MAG: BREX-1 system adenine-specific DNA-methyltransferase PglX [Agitococcus sp.]|nr:BREX-1 system adenine-specific DNA-methyltransferase PglX [Agitococcus sp.]